jgi:hypothetical protein
MFRLARDCCFANHPLTVRPDHVRANFSKNIARQIVHEWREFPMLLFITRFGGLLLMMGHHSRAESLFYYFRLEDQVPENHLLRLIDRHVNLEFVRSKMKESYSDTGRPSIDPELLLRMLLIGYLYGVTSERKLVEELRMHLAWRWFTGLGFDLGFSVVGCRTFSVHRLMEL